MGKKGDQNGTERIILFDAVCKLCCGWTMFILRFDKHQTFKLCSVQSISGQLLLKKCDLPTDEFNTMVLIDGETAYYKSDALLKVLNELAWPWRIFSIMQYVPRPLRDYFYDRLAQNRYRLLGKYDQCILPSAEQKARFLD